MTHDELSRKLEGLWHDSYKAPGYQALRAVVELHKPEWVLPKFVLEGTKPEPIAICIHCSDEPNRKLYPCLTIQAIEKELK